MKSRLREWSAVLRDRWRNFFLRRVVWFSRERVDQFGEVSAIPAIVGVIGREFYEERRKAYPIRGYWDLNRVLRMEETSGDRCISIIGPFIDNQREVIFFDLNSRFDSKNIKALFWIPESFLVSRALPRNACATVEREGLTYFVSDSGVSLIRGGALRTPELFGFSLGLPSGSQIVSWSGKDARAAFLVGLRDLSPSVWLRCLSSEIKSAIRNMWQPVAVAMGVTLIVYMVIASAYLFAATKFRESELRNLGDEVEVLLEKQRLVDNLTKENAAILLLSEEQRSTYRLWGISADVMSAGGSVSGVAFSNGETIVRGRARPATAVLAKLAAREDVYEARFSAPVRPSEEGEDFTITIKAKAAKVSRVSPEGASGGQGGR